MSHRSHVLESTAMCMLQHYHQTVYKQEIIIPWVYYQFREVFTHSTELLGLIVNSINMELSLPITKIEWSLDR